MTKFSLGIVCTLMMISLFWYGYTYSLTAEAFFIQGYIGAIIPCLIAAWLFAAGWIMNDLCRQDDD